GLARRTAEPVPVGAREFDAGVAFVARDRDAVGQRDRRDADAPLPAVARFASISLLFDRRRMRDDVDVCVCRLGAVYFYQRVASPRERGGAVSGGPGVGRLVGQYGDLALDGQSAH